MPSTWLSTNRKLPLPPICRMAGSGGADKWKALWSMISRDELNEDPRYLGQGVTGEFYFGNVVPAIEEWSRKLPKQEVNQKFVLAVGRFDVECRNGETAVNPNALRFYFKLLCVVRVVLNVPQIIEGWCACIRV